MKMFYIGCSFSILASLESKNYSKFHHITVFVSDTENRKQIWVKQMKMKIR